MDDIPEPVSLPGLENRGTDRYGVRESAGSDDGYDDSFGAESEPENAIPADLHNGATLESVAAMVPSGRVQEFLKRTSTMGEDDPRILARPIFDELIRSKRLPDWNEAECVIWLSTIGLERYRANFFHNHVTGRTLDRITSDKLKDDVGIGALGHRELIMDEVDEIKARSSEILKRINTAKHTKRHLEKAEERKLESMHMELLRREVEYKDAADTLAKAKKLEQDQMERVEQQRLSIKEYQVELRHMKKEEALQNYGRLSDLKQCTFMPALTPSSVTYAEGSNRGDMWSRIKSDTRQKEQRMKDLRMVEEDTLGIVTRQKQIQNAQVFMMKYLKPNSSAKVSNFVHTMVDEALSIGLSAGHCTGEEKEKILKRKDKEEKLVATYNVLRIHQFLGRYKSEQAHLASKNNKDKKKKPTAEERKQHADAIENLNSRLYPAPAKSQVRELSAEERVRQLQARKEARKKASASIGRFLSNYADDMEKRRMHEREAKLQAVNDDRAKMGHRPSTAGARLGN